MESIVHIIDGLDENDLNFDGLDDDDENESCKNNSKTTLKSPEQDVITNAKDKNNNDDLGDDELLFKVPLDIPSTNRIDRHLSSSTQKPDAYQKTHSI